MIFAPTDIPREKVLTLDFTRGEAKRVFLIADTHFDHDRIIGLSERDFNCIEQMNETLVKNWNHTIGEEDIVFFLGDMAYGYGSRSVRWWLRRLNGRIIFVKGSHDRGLYPTEQWIGHVFCTNCIMVKAYGREFALTHSGRGLPEGYDGWVIHGHTHQNEPFIKPEWKQVSVSVDVINYTPISLASIIERIEELTKEPTEIASDPSRGMGSYDSGYMGGNINKAF